MGERLFHVKTSITLAKGWCYALQSSMYPPSSFILFPFWLFGVPGPTLGFAQRAYRCISVNLLVA